MSSITQSRNQPHTVGPVWTDTDEKVLRKIWRAGGSARRISEELDGRFTRNAVISKVRRLGLHRNPSGPRPLEPRDLESKPAPERRSRFHPAPPTKPEQVESISRFEEPSDGVGVSFLELTNETCRWPKGTPGEPGFMFCGETTADLRAGKPYCPFHTRKRRRL